ncbi:MAG TPA: SIS domain-containing protein [Acidimicrobiales bacterium]|nr:SIS domain-containing protein [Acidimicrobiales bacterium]
MCGIIAVLRRRSSRPAPELHNLLDRVDDAIGRLAAATTGDHDIAALAAGAFPVVATALEAVDAELRGPPGVASVLAVAGGAEALEARGRTLAALLDGVEERLDSGQLRTSPDALEGINSALVRLRDVGWALGRDRPDTARAITALAGDGGVPAPAALDALWSIQVALAALDRLEVRGRDSAGIHLLITGHGIDVHGPEAQAMLGARVSDPLFTSMAVRTPRGHLSLVYKAAAEIGELGDNTRALRAAISTDPLLRLALASPDAEVTVLGHTRWASVGIVSQANAHPVNGDELDAALSPSAPYVVAAVNGDVDNYLELRSAERLALAAEITTDTKVVPVLTSRRLAQGMAMDEAFCQTVSRFDGSMAIAVNTAAAADELHLALRGSGQSLNVGMAEDAFIVASEAYGVVQETPCYLRMDGESTPAANGNGAHSGPGQVVVLDGRRAGTLAGVRRLAYDGSILPIAPEELRTAEITTRDIDRAGFDHYLLKEITEAPQSFRKTLRGKIVTDERTGLLAADVGPAALPPEIVERLRAGAITRICVIGQGTAAVAGHSLANALSDALNSRSVTVVAVLATELSGFALADDMSDTLIIAVSQSGTTTDTNRTVDLARNRGAAIIAVVNRRNSDLVDKSHGVLYTSDGRDVEMSVASTKAFYAQVAAGFLLALDLGRQLRPGDRTQAARADRTLRALRDLPDAMERVLAQRDAIAVAAGNVAPTRRHWAIVGNGPNRVAAAEIRIKLSELCYHSIASDGTEDKKHIDLSSEPMILVCAAGLSGPTADDVAKEVTIYRAHRAAPIVVASEGEAGRFASALHTIEVPAVPPDVAFVLSAMVGHLFGYEAALAIDAQARPLREAKAAIESALGPAGGMAASGAALSAPTGDGLLALLRPALDSATERFFAGLRSGTYNGHLEASTAVQVASLLRYATGVLPIEGYEVEYGKVGTPSAVVADLMDALTNAAGELTRPVDAIKHQAKTVTVGISRSEDALLKVPLVAQTLATGVGLDCLSYRSLRALAALDAGVAEIEGFTRYRIAGDVATDATIEVIDRGGISLGMPSRTERDPRLLGTKHHVAEEREVTVARGGRDGRSLILIPETKANAVTGMTLLHVAFHDYLAPATARQVLSGYRNRYAALSDAVTETEPAFDDEGLASVPLLTLLTEPVYVLAERWKG